MSCIASIAWDVLCRIQWTTLAWEKPFPLHHHMFYVSHVFPETCSVGYNGLHWHERSLFCFIIVFVHVSQVFPERWSVEYSGLHWHERSLFCFIIVFFTYFRYSLRRTVVYIGTREAFSVSHISGIPWDVQWTALAREIRREAFSASLPLCFCIPW